MNGRLENLLCANGANLLGENKHTVCEGNGRGAVLVTGNGVSLVANGEVKVGQFHNTEGGKKCFELLNIWENRNN